MVNCSWLITSTNGQLLMTIKGEPESSRYDTIKVNQPLMVDNGQLLVNNGQIMVDKGCQCWLMMVNSLSIMVVVSGQLMIGNDG